MELKSIFRYVGLAALALVFVAQQFGIEPDPATAQGVADMILFVLGLLGIGAGEIVDSRDTTELKRRSGMR